MADISNEINAINTNNNAIKNSVYGKDVRGAMSTALGAAKDAIVKVNSEAPTIPDGSITREKLDSDVAEKLTSILTVESDPDLDITLITNSPSETNEQVQIFSSGIFQVISYLFENTRIVNSLQTLVFKAINLNTYTSTINLNSIFPSHHYLCLRGDGTGEFENQVENFPPVQAYNSYKFLYLRVLGMELFQSEYDNEIWRRTGVEESWQNITSIAFCNENLNQHDQTFTPIDLNTIYPKLSKMYLRGEGTQPFQIQLSHCPPVQSYDSENFVFLRLPGFQFFKSDEDNKFWYRSNNNGTWTCIIGQ